MAEIIKFNSELENLHKVEYFAKKLKESYQLDESVFSNILISLTEAVNNAIIHGNCNDKNKSVTIRECKSEDGVQIQVEDEGVGFRPEAIPDPTLDENLEKIGGRGVMIMKHLADNVRFINNGSCVELTFHMVRMTSED